ncbi:putative toluene tolerance protein [Methylophaga frappieri]|uniref:Putative toluene tolerance protein n=1 Tax=Methylophaga frappieri (strain ATCC BAA-2434 / DSM 25690 / JAM7) TaxID=754477 RepID=I1YIP8_METFJ|nr:ABC transporter substrate-binding protein [Methylophaga frappieri]AFJ02791.1 putative toluene tolerance protein [Methylophaga frappieri]
MMQLLKSPKQFTAMLLSLALLAVIGTVSAADMPAPQALVKTASDDMLAALKENEAKLEADPTQIYGLVEEILIPHFDFARMAKLALGKNWHQLDGEQQKQFVEEFRILLVRTYSTAMLEYTEEEIRFLPFHDDLSKKRVNVPMEVVQTGGPAIPMVLSLYQNKEDAWKVYDVKIEGISLVTNYRSSFARDINNGGVEKLLADLTARNQKARL